MAIFRAIGNQPQDIVLQAFVDGATLTPKGALTYWYNCKRKLARDIEPLQRNVSCKRDVNLLKLGRCANIDKFNLFAVIT